MTSRVNKQLKNEDAQLYCFNPVKRVIEKGTRVYGNVDKGRSPIKKMKGSLTFGYIFTLLWNKIE